MYSPDILNEIDEKKLDDFDILKEGRVLKFDIAYKEQKIVNYFHAMYYE